MTHAALQQGSAAIPEAEHATQPSSVSQIDQAIETVREHAEEWAALSVGARIAMLDELLESTLAVADRWVDEACKAKRIARGTPTEAEEWFGGPITVIRNIVLLARSLRDIQTHGTPQLPKKPTVRPDGQVVAQVFPTDTWDKIMFGGFTAEVWMDPSVTPSSLKETMGVFYTDDAPKKGCVSLVLGAGNVSSIGAMDALYKLFVEGEVVVLKMNPVNAYLGPVTDEAFRELVRRGFLRVVYGGAKEGDYLCTHEGIDTIHITGSDKTHDAIVWGVGNEGADRKRRDEPRNDKPITSELGNVTPIIVVPGPWSQAELDFHGENIASSLANNAGFNCNATRVVITHAGWNQRTALLDAVKRAFQQMPTRAPYYPGAEGRHEAFVAAHPQAFQFGPRGEGRVPWTFIADVDATAKDDICFTTEAWCGVTSETALEASDAVDFLEKAVNMANETLWGTLSCSIVVHPKSMNDPRIARAVDSAIAKLRYGSVVINHWSALSYGFVSPTWGAYPGHTKEDIGSGIGVVHNTYLFDRPQKSVIRGPFVVKPKPAWFVTNRTAHELGPKLAKFTARPTVVQIPSLLFSAIRA